MRITADISLYPLEENFVDDIKAFIHALRAEPGLEVVTNQVSTQVRGDYDAVTGAITRCMRETMQHANGTRVFAVKYLNADLDISRPPNV
jgi:uncharacterized protein YqgV (UPF0045/DUF77 family)